MGLLDSLAYGNQGGFGGLLDLLRTQGQYQPSAGFPQENNQPSILDTAQWPAGPVGAPLQASPIAIGSNYQMPRIGPQAAFTPDPAAIPQNAQPALGQLPAQQPMQAPDQTSAFGAAGSILSRFGNPDGLIARLTGNDSRSVAVQQQNQTAQYLVKNGMDPALAKSVVADPALLRSVLPQMMGIGGTTDDIKEYQFAKKEDPSLTFNKFMQQKKAVSGEYSLTPQYGTNDKGETVLVQTGKSGEAIQTKLPEGVKISSGVDKIDLGTSWGIVDKRTGQLIGQQPKDVAGKASQEVQGEAQGKAVVALPTVLNTAQQSIDLVDEMIKHPGRETATGLSGTLDPRNYIGGTDAKNFQIRAKQVEGRTFLSAFDQLRGAGAITEAEGQKATAATARLDRAQSDTEYLAALNELKAILTKGMEIARQKAGQPPASAAPAGGSSVDALLKKYGG